MFIPLCFYYLPYIGISYLVTVPYLIVIVYFLFKGNFKKLFFYSALGLLSWVFFFIIFLFTQSYIVSTPRLQCEEKSVISFWVMLIVLVCITLFISILHIKKVNVILNKRITIILSLMYLLLFLIPAFYLTSSDVRSSNDEIIDILLLLPIQTAYYLYGGNLANF